MPRKTISKGKTDILMTEEPCPRCFSPFASRPYSKCLTVCSPRLHATAAVGAERHGPGEVGMILIS